MLPPEEGKTKDPEERKERLERLRLLMDERGEDVVKLLRTWLSEALESKKR